jgi:Uma2 family endonuclease
MSQAASFEPRYTTDEYFRLVETGALGPGDRVELLEGVIVTMAPQNPSHASHTKRAYDVLRDAVGARAVVRSQLPLVASGYSVPEPDVAVVSGREADYYTRHPDTALLVVEVADTTLVQDRLTKAGLFAAAGIPEYWIVNLRDAYIEIFRDPEPSAGRYASPRIAYRGERLDLVALPDVGVPVDMLLPEDS